MNHFIISFFMSPHMATPDTDSIQMIKIKPSLLLFFILSFYIFNSPALAKPPGNSTYKVLLAKTWNGETEVKGWWMSEKLDGVRAYWTGSQLISRTGNPFPAPKSFTENFPDTPLDGELWLGRDQFQQMLSIVRTKKISHKGWKKVRYYVFDAPKVKGGFEERQRFIKDWFINHRSLSTVVLSQERCQSRTHLFEKLKQIEALKGEGVMLRKPKSKYETGRSNTLLKVKSYRDSEATVVGYLPGKGKYSGMVGALMVKMLNGKQFAIGSGLTDQLRKTPPSIGTVITYKYYGLTQSGVPRFASYIRIWDGL